MYKLSSSHLSPSKKCGYGYKDLVSYIYRVYIYIYIYCIYVLVYVYLHYCSSAKRNHTVAHADE